MEGTLWPFQTPPPCRRKGSGGRGPPSRREQATLCFSSRPVKGVAGFHVLISDYKDSVVYLRLGRAGQATKTLLLLSESSGRVCGAASGGRAGIVLDTQTSGHTMGTHPSVQGASLWGLVVCRQPPSRGVLAQGLGRCSGLVLFP